VPDPFGFDAVDLDWLRAKPGAKWHRHPGALAAWVADMDFRPPPVVVDALQSLIDGGDLGYPDWKTPMAGSPVRDTWAERCARRYGWAPDAHLTREFCDVVQAIEAVLHLCTSPGDGIVVHAPSYPPFLRSVDDTRLRLVPVPAEPDGDRWTFDHDALDASLSAESARVLLLCHPHNPTGHVFGRAELERLAEIAERHDLLVISDEIHADLTYAPATHVPMAAVLPDRTVTIHSASKAFNLAGLRYAIAHLGPEWVRERFEAAPGHLFGAISRPAAVATEVVWRDGDPWLAAVIEHLDRNRRLLADLLAEHLPAAGYRLPEATYLAWLDCRALGLDGEPVDEFGRRGVVLSGGPDFGPRGAGHVRVNFATSAAILTAIVERMATA
jgi:cystathionine beta-lyase